MAKVLIEITADGQKAILRLNSAQTVFGSDVTCDVVLPQAGIAPKHFILNVDAGLMRVRALQERTSGSVAGRELSTEWQILHPKERITLSTAGGGVGIQVKAVSSYYSGAIVRESELPSTAPRAGAFAPQVATLADVESGASLFSPPRQLGKAREPKSKRAGWSGNSMALLFASLVLVMIVGIVTAGIVKQTGRSRQSRAVGERTQSIHDNIDKAREEIKRKEFVKAKQSLDTARETAEAIGKVDEFRTTIDAMVRSPQIRYGANGYTEFESVWHPGDQVKAEVAARERDGPRLEEFRRKVTDSLTQKDYENARRYCDDALEILSQHTLPPSPVVAEFTSLKTRVQNQLVAADMLAKGMVLYDEKWITPDQKSRLQKEAVGLAEYRGKWLPKAEAFAAEQTDKGLVLFEGKWMTPDDRRVAQGYVQFEGNWVLKEERETILAARAEQDRRERAALEAERQRLEAAARARGELAARLERQKPDAYAMSQAFLRDTLKAPRQAEFPDYADAKVRVVVSDGWFLVSAYVDAPNAFNTMLRKSYMSKLRPVGGDKWESEATFLLDD